MLVTKLYLRGNPTSFPNTAAVTSRFSFLQKNLLSILVHHQHYFICGVCNRINDAFKEIDDLLISGGDTGSTLWGHP